jgi:hypothetical protein
MTTSHSLINLSTSSPTALSPTVRHSGLDITIQNVNDSGYIYVGGSNVTTTNYGYRIPTNSAISFELPGRDFLYAVSSASDMKAAVIIIGLEIGD